jgi:hypothetical protein
MKYKEITITNNVTVQLIIIIIIIIITNVCEYLFDSIDSRMTRGC